MICPICNYALMQFAIYAGRFLPRHQDGGAIEDQKIRRLGRGGRCLALLEAFATENRTSLGRPEGYGSFLAAGRAVGAGFGALIVAAATVVAGRPYLPRPLGLARFTALRLVLELFIVEKKLLARREDEVRAAVHALQNPILEFH